MEYDYAFEMATSNIRFGPGVTREVGMDLADLNVKRVMVLTDPALRDLPPVAMVLESLSDQKVEYSLFDRVRVEPTDGSLREAIEFASAEPVFHISARRFSGLRKSSHWQGPARARITQTPLRNSHHGWNRE